MEHETQQIERLTQYSVEANKLIMRLRDGQPGEELTDAELETIAGCACDPKTHGRGYGALQSAIRWCEANGIVWRRVRKGALIRCLTGSDVVSNSRDDMRGMHRRARRVARRLGMTDTSTLSQDERVKHSVLAAHVGTIAMLAHGTTINKAISVSESGGKLTAPSAAGLISFLESKNREEAS